MTHVQAILIDDEPRSLSAMQTLLEFNCPDVDVIGTFREGEDAISALVRLQPDLVFLDIAMPGMNAFELLNRIPEINFEIIFVTAHSEYSLQALHLSAVDYLLKPVEDDLLIEAVKRAKARISDKTGRAQIDTFLHNLKAPKSGEKMKLCIPSMKGFQVVEIADIIYCEASSNYTFFHFADRPVICSSKPIHEYEALLDDCNFVRTHKSYLVNLAHLQEYVRGDGGSVLVTGGRVVEVSRRKKEELLNRMKGYFRF